jgi:hypothetical protein
MGDYPIEGVELHVLGEPCQVVMNNLANLSRNLIQIGSAASSEQKRKVEWFEKRQASLVDTGQ